MDRAMLHDLASPRRKGPVSLERLLLSQHGVELEVPTKAMDFRDECLKVARHGPGPD